jgi:glycosyltransferase involved in cell wall biosynthesis
MRNELLKNGVAENKISLLSPYVDAVETAETQPSGKLKILFASQHVASKGLHLLFESLTKVKSDFELTILGEGSRTPFYKDLAKEFGIAKKTIFAGFVNNPEDFYKRTDVAVFPSMWQEPFGLVGIEAMAYARPVVAFDVGGVRQWLIDGKNGIIVPERNTTLFAEALDKLAQNPSLVKSLGENGRDFVHANFTRENFLKTFLQLQ